MSTDPILFFDLKTPSKRLRADIERRLNAILDHGWYIGGPEVTELEQKLAAFTGARHALAVASGTDALVIALMGEESGARRRRLPAGVHLQRHGHAPC